MSKNKPYLVTIILLSLTLAGVIYFGQEINTGSSSIRLQKFPQAIGEWKGKDLALPERALELLETRDVLMREYTNSQGEKVYLFIVYSPRNRSSFHPPEICYLGGGTELLNKSVEEIKVRGLRENSPMQVNKLLMKDRLGEQLAWYWFYGGERIISNYYRKELLFIWDKIRKKQGGGALVRVSTRVIKEGLKEANALGEDFIRQIASLMSDYLDKKSN